MRQEGLRVAYDEKRRRRYGSCDRAADDADREAAPDVPLQEDVSHDFAAPEPNVLWVTDVTEFRPCWQADMPISRGRTRGMTPWHEALRGLPPH